MVTIYFSGYSYILNFSGPRLFYFTMKTKFVLKNKIELLQTGKSLFHQIQKSKI